MARNSYNNRSRNATRNSMNFSIGPLTTLSDRTFTRVFHDAPRENRTKGKDMDELRLNRGVQLGALFARALNEISSVRVAFDGNLFHSKVLPIYYRVIAWGRTDIFNQVLARSVIFYYGAITKAVFHVRLVSKRAFKSTKLKHFRNCVINPTF